MPATLTEPEIRRIDWLLEHGLGASARAVIGDVARGSAANSRRGRCDSARPVGGLYLPMTDVGGRRAWNVPVEVELDGTAHGDERARAALDEAEAAARHHIGLGFRRRIQLSLERHWAPEGWSLGLASGLAFLSTASGRKPLCPIFATGRLHGSGEISAVDHTALKVGAALADIDGIDGRVLVPWTPEEAFDDPRVIRVRSFAEAVVAAFGPDALTARPEFRELIRWLHDLKRSRSDDALRELEGIDETALAPRDRVRLLTHRGVHLRHVGRTEEADRAHAEATTITSSIYVDLVDRQELELEVQNTRLDFFETEGPIRWMEARVAQASFATLELEMRTRGTLSRAYATAGDLQRALDVRRAMLSLHGQDQRLASELPQTLTELAVLSARAGDAAGFDHAIDRLAAHDAVLHAGPSQHVWNTHAIVRGSVALGRAPAVVEWFDGTGTLRIAAPYRDVVGAHSPAARGGHPTHGIVRALIRALRQVGRHEDAIQVAESMEPGSGGLVGWLGWLCRLEGSLAMRALGRTDEAGTQRDHIRSNLVRCSDHASRHYASILHGDWDDMERALTSVVY